MSALDDIRQRAADTSHPVHWDARDRDRLLAALDAVLALADRYKLIEDQDIFDVVNDALEAGK